MFAPETITQRIARAETLSVEADKAEQSGDAETSRLRSREAAASYALAAEQAMGISLALAGLYYRSAETAYRRGRSHGRALRMQIRAENAECEEAARLARDARWLAREVSR